MTITDREHELHRALHALADASEAWCEAKAGRHMTDADELNLTLAEKRVKRVQSKLDAARRKVIT